MLGHPAKRKGKTASFEQFQSAKILSDDLRPGEYTDERKIEDLLKLEASLSEALAVPYTSSLKLAISAAEGELDRQHLTFDYHEYRAKHPVQSRKSLPATTDRNRLLVGDPLDETLILVNESGRAGVVRNIRGDLVFDRGQASLCFLHDNGGQGRTDPARQP